jgi:alpha-1,3-rhamnosyl/mannosyltransferase
VPGLGRLARLLDAERRSRGRRISRLLDADLFHLSGVQPEAPRGAPTTVTFFDPSALEHPEWHTPDTVRFSQVEAGMIRHGSFVLAISEWSASRAREIFGRDHGIGVIGGAADGIFTPGEPDPGVLGSLGLERDRFLLHVGNFVPRKNIPMMIEAHAAAARAGMDLPLVLAGAGGWKEPCTVAAGVKVLRAIPDVTLLSLYRGARALLLPSVYEGLGLPALEAMACGCGVVAADSTALPETLGGCGLLLPPDDRAAWSEAMNSLRDGSLSRELRAMAAARPRPTWDEVAGRTCRLYCEAAGGR